VARLTRYNTGRKYIVSFGTTYHGWTDSLISPLSLITASDGQISLPLFNMKSIETISHYAYDIAAVMFNPMTCIDIRYNDTLLSVAKFNESKERWRADTNAWLKELERVCSMFGIALVFDEVYGNFRMGSKLSHHYLTDDVQPDVVVLGKTIGTGIPIGILVGHEHYLRRQKTDYQFNKSVVVGTFSMSCLAQHAVSVFLDHIKTTQPTFDTTFLLMDKTLVDLNEALKAKELPIWLSRVGLLVTTSYSRKSPYNWMFQFYLLQSGIFTCAYGTARMNFNISFTEKEAATFAERFVNAAEAMQRDGWWSGKERNIVSGIYAGKLVLNTLVRTIWCENYDYVMLSKRIDLDVSHLNRLNFMTHYFSSLIFVPTYFLFLCTPYKLTSLVIFLIGQVNCVF
jgi:glutamate-1-semialdehyde 2,1-aminomutase